MGRDVLADRRLLSRSGSVLVIGLAFLCTACASDPIAADTPEALRTEPLMALCSAVRHADGTKDRLLAELLRRRAIRQEKIADIRRDIVTLGMNHCEALAAWGAPQSYDEPIGRNLPDVATAFTYDGGHSIYFDKNGTVMAVQF